mmetsp:Transcript_5529/g.8123  ORF Transcript_5529/g.8123 Transcript_5529/m.8123 type:complete len:302 (+) Transcript_5529:1692-2597(+)
MTRDDLGSIVFPARSFLTSSSSSAFCSIPVFGVASYVASAFVGNTLGRSFVIFSIFNDSTVEVFVLSSKSSALSRLLPGSCSSSKLFSSSDIISSLISTYSIGSFSSYNSGSYTSSTSKDDDSSSSTSNSFISLLSALYSGSRARRIGTSYMIRDSAIRKQARPPIRINALSPKEHDFATVGVYSGPAGSQNRLLQMSISTIMNVTALTANASTTEGSSTPVQIKQTGREQNTTIVIITVATSAEIPPINKLTLANCHTLSESMKDDFSSSVYPLQLSRLNPSMKEFNPSAPLNSSFAPVL